jgi:hypothetical protein
VTQIDAPIHAPALDDERVSELARRLVDGGRVAPGLEVLPDGRGRSWWWPLPDRDDDERLAELLPDDTSAGHATVASALAGAVDRLVRERLGETPGSEREPSADSEAELAWLRALAVPDPVLPDGLEEAELRALADRTSEWVRTAGATIVDPRLGLRIHEPTGERRTWRLELVAADVSSPTQVVPLAELWLGSPAFAPAARERILVSLGAMARVAPELAPLLDEAAPSGLSLEAEAVVAFVRARAAALAAEGIAILLPAWWTRRRRVGLRARTAAPRTGGSAATTTLGLDALIEFTWEAALEGSELTRDELDALQEAARAQQPLVRMRGGWVHVDPAALDAMLANVGRAGRATAGELVRAEFGLGPDHLAPGAEIVGIDADGWLEDLLDEAVHSRIEPVRTPAGFVGQLRPYQERGVGWLVFLGRLGLGALLADDMGLGKTPQAIATVLADPAPGPTLVICPVSVLGNWRREIERFAPGLRIVVHHGADRIRAHEASFASRAASADIVLTSYSLVARDSDLIESVGWGRLVLDEAQQVKNPTAGVSRAVARIRAGRRIALTGTPVENRLGDLWSLMHILNPGLLGSSARFQERFARPIEELHDPEQTAVLRRLTGPFLLRRLKTDRAIISDLPDKIEQTERCPLTTEQATLYQAVVDDLLARAATAEGIGRRGLVLAGLMRLKQVCNHPAHFARDGSPLAGRSGKLARVEELLDEIVEAGDSVLCFTQFAEWGSMLQPYLAERYGREPLWLHGGTPRARREEQIAAFQSPGGPQIFLLSLKAGGMGLNLTAASHVIHLDRWWNPAVEDQATDRAHRIGQRRTVLVHKLVSAGTVEERIDEMITRKRALAERVVGAGEEWITGLDTDELREVIALRPTDDEL